jgi:hypothetical protein
LKIVTYTRELFPPLAAAAATASAGQSLCHRSFVDYYYTTNDQCRLFLAVDDRGAIAAAIGIEQMPFDHGGRPVVIGFASNFVAFAKGAGSYVFLHWVRSSELACIYGGSEDTHRILQSQKWTYFSGIRLYGLNARYTVRSGEPGWRRAAKSILGAVLPSVDLRRLAERAGREPAWRNVRSEEVSAASEDMLPTTTPFTFRLKPTVAYLNWRYATTLPFVRYRMFRIRRDGAPCGYVIVNERPHQWMIAQTDGVDEEVVVGGVIQALGELARVGRPRREVLLACAHTDMAARYRGLGFVAAPQERSFALGSRRRALDWSQNTSRWHVNFDWTDNGLRRPFLDEQSIRPSAPLATAAASTSG